MLINYIRYSYLPCASHIRTALSPLGALYLHPVQLQLQLRPSLDYLDALDQKMKEDRKRSGAGGEDSDSDDEEAKPAEVGKAVSVSLRTLSSCPSSRLKLSDTH